MSEWTQLIISAIPVLVVFAELGFVDGDRFDGRGEGVGDGVNPFSELAFAVCEVAVIV